MAEYDVVVWGATGFTGRLVAEYLATRYGFDGELRWTIAGRSADKLEALRRDLAAPEGRLVPLLAESHDVASLRALAGRTRVVCSTVGPYARYGNELVGVCAALGVDYCDLTGEVAWMRRMIDTHDAAARASGARIVPSCGFDCIPSDLGVHFVQRLMHERHGVYAPAVKFRALEFRGGFSGGTAASMLAMMDEVARDPDVRRLIADPYALNPQGVRGLDGPDSAGAFYDADFKAWAAPFMMASINTRVVRRSHALAGLPYGPDFRYDEAMLMGDGPLGMARALGLSIGSAAGQAVSALAPARTLLARVVPAPGEGPSAQAREQGFFRIALLAKHPVDAGRDVRAQVTGDRDPGYGSTAKMLGESAVCLAKDGLNSPGGFGTPAATLGDALLRRLTERAGVKFEAA